MPELAHHHVERSVRIREVLRVAFGPNDPFRLGDAGVVTSLIEQFGREVEAGDPRSGPCGGDGHHAGARAHVEDGLIRGDAGEVHESTCHWCGEHRGGRKGRPRLSLPLLEVCERLLLVHAVLRAVPRFH
jgi:hypothetical protein